ncbi:MAG: HigA family addiction module antitoxin [Chitinophagaceae bacterium]
MLKQGMKPVHPGQILKETYLQPLGLNQTDTAANLGVARKTLSMLLNGRQGISAEMALRLAKAFNTTPELWLNMQQSYDLWNAGQKVRLAQIKVFKVPKKNIPAGRHSAV